MRMRVLTKKLRVEIENEMRVFLESLNFEIEMRVSQKSARYRVLMKPKQQEIVGYQVSLLLPLVNFKKDFLKTA